MANLCRTALPARVAPVPAGFDSPPALLLSAHAGCLPVLPELVPVWETQHRCLALPRLHSICRVNARGHLGLRPECHQGQISFTKLHWVLFYWNCCGFVQTKEGCGDCSLRLLRFFFPIRDLKTLQQMLPACWAVQSCAAWALGVLQVHTAIKCFLKSSSWNFWPELE